MDDSGWLPTDILLLLLLLLLLSSLPSLSCDPSGKGSLFVTGAPCRKMNPKVATAPKTQSPLTIKVEIMAKFDSRIKR